MEPIPVRLWEDDKDALEAEAADKNISVSAYTRDLLQKGRAFDAQEHEDVLRKYTLQLKYHNLTLQVQDLRKRSRNEGTIDDCALQEESD